MVFRYSLYRTGNLMIDASQRKRERDHRVLLCYHLEKPDMMLPSIKMGKSARGTR